jgi:transposase
MINLRIRRLQWIGIDEISYGKNHRYLTLVVDHVTGRVVHVAQGRKEESLYRFFKRLRKLKAPIEVITGDMWRPYLSVIRTFYPDSHVVYDKYHIIANLNKSLDELRRKEYHA